MSCEDDDYGWDDPEPIVEIRKINLLITTISKKRVINNWGSNDSMPR